MGLVKVVAKEETPKEEAKEDEKGAEVGGEDEPKKEEEAVEAAESTATFEPVVSIGVCAVSIVGYSMYVEGIYPWNYIPKRRNNFPAAMNDWL